VIFAKSHIILFLTVLAISHSTAQVVAISGFEPDYADYALSFYAVDNHFSKRDIKIGECIIGTDGNFILEFQIEKTRQIYAYLGVFFVRFYVEPGFSYEIKLPPRIDKTPEERENPFFEGAIVPMLITAVKDDTNQTIPVEKDLNHKIVNFDAAFNDLFYELAADTVIGVAARMLDTLIYSFRQTIVPTGHEYFDNYTFYSSGLLYYAAQRSSTNRIIGDFFAESPVLLDHHAYMELFNTTFDRYFMFFGRDNNAIFDVINRWGSFSELKRLFGQDGVLPNDSLRELVILKNAHDEFYTNRFSREALLNILDSAMIHSNIERHREIANEIHAKLTRLMRGFDPPDFKLLRHDSAWVSLQDYRDKWVYLMFCSTQNNACLAQYELLEVLHQMHHGWLDIVVISVDDSFSDVQNFKQTSGYQWDFLHFGNEPDIIDKYDVRIFPTSFLIDNNGKLVLSPAPAPTPIYDPENAGLLNLDRIFFMELRGRQLWQEYFQRGLINFLNVISTRSSLNQTLYADETSTRVWFATTGSWTSTVRYPDRTVIPWINVAPDSGDEAGSGSVVVNLTPNTTGFDRKAEIIITSGRTSVTVNLTQKTTNKDGSAGYYDMK